MKRCKRCGSQAMNDDPLSQLCDCCWRDAEIERLQAQLDRYTRATLDGVRVGPGDYVYNSSGRELRMVRWATDTRGQLAAYPEVCYSTREAAEAARTESQE